MDGNFSVQDSAAPDLGRALSDAIEVVRPIVAARLNPAVARRMPRREIASEVEAIVAEIGIRGRVAISEDIRRDLVTLLIDDIVGDRGEDPPETERLAPASQAEFEPNFSLADLTAPALPRPANKGDARSETIETAKRDIQPVLMERIDVSKAGELPRNELATQISAIVSEIATERKIRLNMSEQRDLVTMLLNDMLGLGPLEPLLADDAVTDIMVNGPKQVYVERKGKLELTDVVFKDNRHVQNIATRIVTRIGRRIDESSPLCDARLEDGSRVNIIIPPLAIDGPSISIRKFSKKTITLDVMTGQKNISAAMATVLKVASRSRLNILISGGTGSGKTTLLNAMSQLIDLGERIVTIEDAAELQLQQPHVVRLETRPANLEGEGEITMRDLVKNSLRMRPDRIILGEVHGSEAVDMLQAMNTGHEGSMCTVMRTDPVKLSPVSKTWSEWPASTCRARRSAPRSPTRSISSFRSAACGTEFAGLPA